MSLFLIVALGLALLASLYLWSESARVANQRGETIKRLRDENAMLRRGLQGVMEAVTVPAVAAASRQSRRPAATRPTRRRRAGRGRW